MAPKDQGAEGAESVTESYPYPERLEERDAANLFAQLLSQEEEGTGEEDEQEEASEDHTDESEADDEQEDVEVEDEEESDDGEVVDDDEYEDEDDEELDDENLVTVKVDGELYEVTLDELKSGYSFNRHNTQRAQELAEREKDIAEQVETVRQERELYSQGLTQIEEALSRFAPQEPDWDKLEREDPQKFAVERARWQRHQEQLGKVKAEQQAVAEKQLEDQLKQLEQYRAQEAEKLTKAIPEWSDTAVATTEGKKLTEYARSILGFQPEELAQVYDHRAVVMLRKAMLYDELVGDGKDVVEKKRVRRKQGKTLKPGTSKRSRKSSTPRRREVKRSREALAKSGSMRAAEELFRNLLADE